MSLSWDTLSREWGAAEGEGGYIQSEERKNIPSAIHLLTFGAGDLTQRRIMPAFVQNILIKILSAIDTQRNHRTSLSAAD